MLRGIDISSHDGAVDLAALQKAGLQFVILRAGYGIGHVDSRFREHLGKAKALGIPTGVYWFSYATNRSEAVQEAKACLAAIGGEKLALPVFYDFEYDTVRYAAEKGITLGRKEFSAFAEGFLDTVAEKGYRPGIYYNPDYLKNYLNSDEVKKKGWARWLAHYVKDTAYAYDLWQYSESGSFAGVKGKFDLDYLREELLEQPKQPGTLQIALHVLSKATKAENPPAEVKTLQRLLRELGVPGNNGKPLEIDGSFGGGTDRAVRTFQAAKGLQADGIVGENSWNALLK